MELDIHHDVARHRMTTIVDGQECELDYRISGGVMTILHTGVPSAVGGRGIGGQLVRAAFEYAREQGWKVVPACSYAADFVRRHPEYATLTARG